MKADTSVKKPSSSTQINDTITLADITKKFKSMGDPQIVKYKSIIEKLISYESKINVLNNSFNVMLTAINDFERGKYHSKK